MKIIRKLGSYPTWRSLALLGFLPICFTTLADVHWLFELFCHFHLQYLGINLSVLVIMLANGKKKQAAIPFSALCWSLTLVLSEPRGRATKPPIHEPIKVALANVQRINRHPERVIAWIQQERPHVVAILEGDRFWKDALNVLDGEYPYQLVYPRPDNSGIALYGRLPLTEPKTFTLPGSLVKSIEAQIALQGSPVKILVTHPVPPVGGAWAESRRLHLKALATRISGSPGPTILIGDLNTSPWSPRYRDLLDSTSLVTARLGFFSAPTWPTWLPVLGTPIDHILITPHFQATEFKTGPNIGSDHWPIIATISLTDS